MHERPVKMDEAERLVSLSHDKLKYTCSDQPCFGKFIHTSTLSLDGATLCLFCLRLDKIRSIR